MCLTRSSIPGSTGLESTGRPARRDPFASIQRAIKHLVYSKAKEAKWKRQFDETMAASGLQIDPTSGLYWRSLLGCLVGPVSCPEAGELQFFLVRGGYEGFLSQQVKHVDANRVKWESRSGTTDINDAMVVLDTDGNYVGAFQLAVPNYYPRTAQMVASDWNGRAVFSYYNRTYSYFGLAVLDQGKLPLYDPKIKKYSYWIDIHHKFGTLGCIEIAGSASPTESNFDSFVAKITKRFGHSLEETFVADKSGYSEVELVPTDAKANAFSVNMKSYLGRIFVVDIPAV